MDKYEWHTSINSSLFQCAGSKYFKTLARPVSYDNHPTLFDPFIIGSLRQAIVDSFCKSSINTHVKGYHLLSIVFFSLSLNVYD